MERLRELVSKVFRGSGKKEAPLQRIPEDLRRKLWTAPENDLNRTQAEV